MNILIKNNEGQSVDLEQTIKQLLDEQYHTIIIQEQQEKDKQRLEQQFIELQQDFNKLQGLILELQTQQNKNHTTIWETIKRVFKNQKTSNITTSVVDLSKE